MPKGYIITRADVIDPEAYARYAAAATKAIADHGGKPLARGGRHEALEGKARGRNVVIEFESYDQARRYFYSQQYQDARKLREGASEMEMVLVEGVLSMAKGYWIAHVDVADPEAYRAYLVANAVAFAKFGGRFLVRAGASQIKEGGLRARHVVIEFPDYASALACYESPEYAAAIALRRSVAQSDQVIIEGYDGPQPG